MYFLHYINFAKCTIFKYERRKIIMDKPSKYDELFYVLHQIVIGNMRL